ncbi:MAG TPA: hypothetical protein VGD54_07800 [Steroidobacteraceae bacterium]
MSHNQNFVGLSKGRRSFSLKGAPLAAFAVALATSSGAWSAGEKAQAPMMIDQQGSFEIGGKAFGDALSSLSDPA